MTILGTMRIIAECLGWAFISANITIIVISVVYVAKVSFEERMQRLDGNHN